MPDRRKRRRDDHGITRRLIRVLGIETSCDETAASVVDVARRCRRRRSCPTSCSARSRNMPPSAAWCRRSRRGRMSKSLDGIVEAALADAGMELADVDAIAATAGPGLVGGLIVGLMTAKAIAAAAGKPLLADQPSRRPCADGAADRRARLSLPAAAGLGRAYPDRAGARRRRLPALGDDDRRCAGRSLRQDGQDARARLSRRTQCREGGHAGRCHAVRLPATDEGLGAARFLVFGPEDGGAPGGGAACAAVGAGCRRYLRLVPGGGVRCAGRPGRQAASRGFARNFRTSPSRRSWLPAASRPTGRSGRRSRRSARSSGFRFIAPPHELCTDNAAMIAWAGHRAPARRARRRMTRRRFVPRSRWPLDEVSRPLVGFGRRGAKA